MTTPLTTARHRNIVAAVLAGGLLTSLSACGGNTTAATSVSEAQPIQGSPMVACGMAQLSPRVPDGDPVLGRAQTFFTQLEQAQSVPPAVQHVYTADVGALNSDQQHEVLLMLSSLNECPDVSPQLQQSVLATFDQLAPQTVADQSADSSAAGSSSSGTDDRTVIIRSDNTTVQDAAADQMIWDGNWNGHPWWFRPTWDHPVTDTADWVQWGNDRRAGVVWRWHDNGWRRIGRPDNDPPSRPWLPTVIGEGRLNHDPGTGGGQTQPIPGQVPPVTAPQATASAQPDVNAPVVRPDFRDSHPGNDFRDSRPDDNTGRPGTTAGTTATTAPTPSSDQQPSGATGQSNSNRDTTRSDSTRDTTHSDTTTTTRDNGADSGTAASTASPAPARDTSTQTRDRSGTETRGSDSSGVSGGMTTRSEDRRHDPNAG